RFWIGVLLALLNGVGLVALALALGMPPLDQLVLTAVAVLIASASFAARGSLFAKSLSHKGWLMALFVVLGEAAVLLTASAMPGVLPSWLLALLPAQWASIALQTVLAGYGMLAAVTALIALAGTAATTLLVARLWPRRWPYVVMFSAWLSLSALVYYGPAP
ncbi:MAG: hypothetical protein AAF337_11800, partial [Pseudomonadota bacterium]